MSESNERGQHGYCCERKNRKRKCTTTWDMGGDEDEDRSSEERKAKQGCCHEKDTLICFESKRGEIEKVTQQDMTAVLSGGIRDETVSIRSTILAVERRPSIGNIVLETREMNERIK